MIFLLTHECVVGVAEVESLVGVNPIMGHGQLLEIEIAQGVPGGLLKRVEADALIARVHVVIISRNLVTIESSIITVITRVLDGGEFGFLLNVHQTVLTELALLGGQLQRRVQRGNAI